MKIFKNIACYFVMSVGLGICFMSLNTYSDSTCKLCNSDPCVCKDMIK